MIQTASIHTNGYRYTHVTTCIKVHSFLHVCALAEWIILKIALLYSYMQTDVRKYSSTCMQRLLYTFVHTYMQTHACHARIHTIKEWKIHAFDCEYTEWNTPLHAWIVEYTMTCVLKYVIITMIDLLKAHRCPTQMSSFFPTILGLANL